MSTLVSPSQVPAAPRVPADAAPVQAPRTLVALLLAAAVSALAVVADRLVDTWADGHLFAAWVAMWTVVFACSLLLAAPARRVAQRVMTVLNGWARRRALARADARFMALASSDSRLMADLRVLRDRAQATASPVTPAVAGLAPATASEAADAPSCVTTRFGRGGHRALPYL